MAETFTPVTLQNDTGQKLNADYFNRLETNMETFDDRIATTELAIANVTSVVTATTQSGTAYTFALGDAGTAVDFTSASAVTVTVPTNASVAFPIGTVIEVTQLGAGQVTIAGAGVTFLTPASLILRIRYAAASLRKTATNTWLVSGDLA